MNVFTGKYVDNEDERGPATTGILWFLQTERNDQVDLIASFHGTLSVELPVRLSVGSIRAKIGRRNETTSFRVPWPPVEFRLMHVNASNLEPVFHGCRSSTRRSEVRPVSLQSFVVVTY